jgi:hypothetical protein
MGTFIVACSGLPASESVLVPNAKKVTPSGRYQVVVTATPQSTTGGFVQTQLIVPFTIQ